MRRQRPIPESGELLNLPLGDPQPLSSDAGGPPGSQELLPFDVAEEKQPRRTHPGNEPLPVGFGRQLRAGLADFTVIAAALGLVIVGSLLFDVRPRIAALPPYLLFTVCFSFLYHVVPLTFWGQTPGMALMDLVARNSDDTALSIQQSILRWAGAALTVVGCGAPLLFLALRGRSLADRLSDSRVRLLQT
ncbi:MAG: RDD family protein [Acidobacteriota bacterium]|nr:RDD family protein [Acidobacteriota bacterium]